MAESESKETAAQQLPTEMIQYWKQLVDDTITPFDIEAINPLKDMMTELAKLSNLCFEHFVRLWLFQQSINEIPEVQGKLLMPKFQSGMGST